MKLIRALVAVTILLTMRSAEAALSDTELTVTHVAGSVYMLEGAGGNVGVSVGEDGILIVDDQFAPLAPKIREALRELNPGPVRFVLNTHHHGDHTGGNAYFSQEAHIVGHANVREQLSRARNHNPDTLPIITFDESLSLHFNGERIDMIHYPSGHTGNDSVIFFRGSDVVHMGDLLFTDSFPSFYTREGGDIEGYAKNVGTLIEMIGEDVPIIAGHGRLATVADLRPYHAMLVETTAIVQQRLDAGMSVEEAEAAGLPETYHRWASSFTSIEQWIGKVYRNLAAK